MITRNRLTGLNQHPNDGERVGDAGSLHLRVEKTEAGFWSYIQRSPGELPKATLFNVLRWVLEQLNFGHFAVERDRSGKVVSLNLGKRSSRFKAMSIDEASEASQSRLLSVNLSGLFAQARERGIEPQHQVLSKQVAQGLNEWGQRNTEFHYAFELIRVLARLHKKTFKLEAPPIGGLAPAGVLSYLGESTRCWLYGFHGASIALSRACLEESLKSSLDPVSLARSDNLENMINVAGRNGKLNESMVQVAHSIRLVANGFLHGEQMTEVHSREALDNTRSIVEELFSDRAAAASAAKNRS